MKKKLEERIRLASENRKREIEKLQSKLAKQERHARQVKERKKQLQIQQQEKLEVSVGGELDKFDRGESGKSLGSELTASDEWNSLSVDSRLSNSKSRIEHVGEVRSASSGQVF